MGYTTNFENELKIYPKLNNEDLGYLNQFLGEDMRDHEGEVVWKSQWAEKADFNYIDLELTKDFQGLKWNQAEKSYGMVEQVNFIIDVMKKHIPEFSLSGVLEAQGEEHDDRWTLVIGKDGYAKKVDYVWKTEKITCPHCDGDFRLEEVLSEEK